MKPGKKMLDIKVIQSQLESFDHFGNETVLMNVCSIDENDTAYTRLKADKKITDRQFHNAIDTIIAKFIQDRIAQVVVDLDIRQRRKRRTNVEVQNTKKKGAKK